MHNLHQYINRRNKVPKRFWHRCLARLKRCPSYLIILFLVYSIFSAFIQISIINYSAFDICLINFSKVYLNDYKYFAKYKS